MMQEEEKKQNPTAQEISIDNKRKDNKDARWKNKFIRVWQLNEQLQQENEMDESCVGPNDFKALMKLGQGSFGVVYLCEKIIKDKNGEEVGSGKFYAMKILNKKQILG